jgi:AcrR family transcriptional regulator
MTTSTSRSRAPRGSLSRDRILDAALALIEDAGVDGVSMPKVAKQLGVGVMSLYTHIDSKDDLLDAIAQHVLDDLPALSGEDWRERLAGHFRSLREALATRPGLGTVLATKNVVVPAVFAILEDVLRDLTDSGVGDDESVHLYYDLLAYTLGFVAWELPRARAMPNHEYAERWRSAVAELDDERHPTVHRLVEPLTSVASDVQFEGGLRRIIGSVR